MSCHSYKCQTTCTSPHLEELYSLTPDSWRVNPHNDPSEASHLGAKGTPQALFYNGGAPQ